MESEASRRSDSRRTETSSPDPFGVIIDPGNPFDFDEDEMNELIQEIQEVEPDAKIVAHFREETEYGGALMEVLHIWIVGRDFVNTNWETMALVAGTVNWLRKRWQRDKRVNSQHPRPRSALVYDQEERPIFSIRIDLPDGEPIAESIENVRHSHRRPAGARRKDREIYDQETDGPDAGDDASS